MTKRTLMKKIIRPIEAFYIWENFYHQALEDHSLYPDDVAWIKFREYFRRGGDGKFQLIIRQNNIL